MPNNLNQKLKEIAEHSALKRSLVPIFICDENFIVCAKSVGAYSLIKSPKVRGSVKNRFDPSILDKFISGKTDTAIAEYKKDQGISNTVIMSDTIDNERYFAIVFELKIGFCPVSEPWYLLSACKEIASSVHMLLSSPDNSSTLNDDCVKLTALCNYYYQNRSQLHSISSSVGKISSILRSLCKEAQTKVSSIGGFIDMRMEDIGIYSSTYSAKELYTFFASLLLAVLLAAKDNRAYIECVPSKNVPNQLELSFTSENCRDEYKGISTFEDLLNTATPIALELAAILDMSHRMNIQLSCVSDGAFKLMCLIPIKKDMRLSNNSPMGEIGTSYVGSILDYLFTIAAPYLNNRS